MLKRSLFGALLVIAIVQVAGCPYVEERIDAGAVVTTSAGEFTIRLDVENAPLTSAAFGSWVEGGYYEGTMFHTVVAGERIQAGGYVPGLVEKQTRSPIVNESGNGLLNTRGTIAMARLTEPDSATAQFYFNVADNPLLDPQNGEPGYAVFGEVVEGIDVVDQIAAVPTTTRDGYGDVPVENVFITAVERLDDVNGNPRVRISTSLGDITVDLDTSAASITVENFLRYVSDGFYVGTIFHRVVPNFIVQGGGLTLGPMAQPDAGTIANESANGVDNTRGTVALYFENNPQEVSSQFYVNVSENPQFNGIEGLLRYPVFGEVIEGMDVVDQIAGIETTTLGTFENLPTQLVTVERIELIDIPTGQPELTAGGEYYLSNGWYQANLLAREIIATTITYGITGW